MKKTFLAIFAAALALVGCKQNAESVTAQPETSQPGTATVYLTRDISPEALVKIYKALGVEATGRVAVKTSTGEGSNPNYLKPELIKDLVHEIGRAHV